MHFNDNFEYELVSEYYNIPTKHIHIEYDHPCGEDVIYYNGEYFGYLSSLNEVYDQYSLYKKGLIDKCLVEMDDSWVSKQIRELFQWIVNGCPRNTIVDIRYIPDVNEIEKDIRDFNYHSNYELNEETIMQLVEREYLCFGSKGQFKYILSPRNSY